MEQIQGNLSNSCEGFGPNVILVVQDVNVIRIHQIGTMNIQYVQTFMVISPIVVEIFLSGLKWLTSHP